ncbi:uncharacterized protein LOC119091986 [Pollicipes pollicipes]|uniref:uncharacterized protein LOC119091986 n=1 Tax=Pollicipes pollicipes TaxID=41117 RepID=UPI001884B1CC|nr:uncharacterized protein LOC119091986 [Pollicipes pollicipes]
MALDDRVVRSGSLLEGAASPSGGVEPTASSAAPTLAELADAGAVSFEVRSVAEGLRLNNVLVASSLEGARQYKAGAVQPKPAAASDGGAQHSGLVHGVQQRAALAVRCVRAGRGRAGVPHHLLLSTRRSGPGGAPQEDGRHAALRPAGGRRAALLAVLGRLGGRPVLCWNAGRAGVDGDISTVGSGAAEVGLSPSEKSSS